MTLATEWTARVSTARAVELTNPDDATATAVDATRLAAAAADAGARFTALTGVSAISLTDARHVQAGVLGITAVLYSYRALPQSAAGEAAEKAFADACDGIRRQSGGAGAPVMPRTSSTLDPTTDADMGRTKPSFDPANLGSLLPAPPSAGGAVASGWWEV